MIEKEGDLFRGFNWVGTYVMGNRFFEMPGLENSTQNDNYVILYLRENSKFLILGFWDGYENSFAWGEWRVTNNRKIELTGRLMIQSYAVQSSASVPYRRALRLDRFDFTPVLRAESEIKGASLVGLAGCLYYLGKKTIFKPHEHARLPSNDDEIESLIHSL